MKKCTYCKTLWKKASAKLPNVNVIQQALDCMSWLLEHKLIQSPLTGIPTIVQLLQSPNILQCIMGIVVSR